MTLEPGYRLDHYQIEEIIGKGGMGEVYRATDTRLPAEVAIKTSQQKFSERFAREAQVIPISARFSTIAALGRDGLPYAAGAVSRSRAKY